MKYLFGVMHGDYRRSGGLLTDLGNQRASRLAAEIKTASEGMTKYLVSSTARRAMQTAEIISKALGLQGDFESAGYIAIDEVGNRGGYDGDPEKLWRFVDERLGKAECLILVTHENVVEDLTGLAPDKMGIDMDPVKPKKGQALVFDLEGKAYRVLPSD